MEEYCKYYIKETVKHKRILLYEYIYTKIKSNWPTLLCLGVVLTIELQLKGVDYYENLDWREGLLED